MLVWKSKNVGSYSPLVSIVESSELFFLNLTPESCENLPLLLPMVADAPMRLAETAPSNASGSR